MTQPTQNPGYAINDLAELLARRMRDVSASLNSCLIGSITAINSNGTVTCAVSFQKVLKGIIPLPSGVMGDQIVDYPVLVNVPVFIYQGGGAYIQMPIVVGDACLLLFCDRDMDIWFQTGQIAPPNSDRVHNINDAIALVGINDLPSQLPPNTSGVINVVDKTGERLSQSGMMSAYGGSTAPAGWLLCDGSSYSRTLYPQLFAIIGTTYGSVDGTHFNVPNMQGQVPAGIGGTLGLTLGQEFGEVNHTLTVTEMPSHTHGSTFNSHGSGNVGSNGNGQFGFPDITGGGASHNNVQPSLGVQWIIKI